jgi:7-cyano-7-deazaguanine synthase
MKKATLIVSGGMDSATLAYHYSKLGYELHLVGFDYGQRHVKELLALRNLADVLNATYEIVDLKGLKSSIANSSLTSDDIVVPDGHYAEETMRITVVPNRNAIMLSIATGIAVANGSELVGTGVHSGDHFIYPDCRPDFIEAINKAFILGTQGHSVETFRVEAPFVQILKSDIAALGHEYGVPYQLTWSCYKGGNKHCGRCGTCVERIEAFIDAGVNDPTLYEDGIEFALEEIAKHNNA